MEQDPLADLPDNIQWVDKRTGKRGAAPPKGLVAQLKSKPAQSAVAACVSVQDLLDLHHVSYRKKAVEATIRLPLGSFLNQADIHSISVPVVSLRGNEAVLYASGVAGPTAGGDFLEYLKRLPSGRWVVVSSAGLWIS